MATETVTVKDVLSNVRQILGDINVPGSMIQSIGIPIARAIDGIQMCLNAFAEEEASKEKPTEEDDGDA